MKSPLLMIGIAVTMAGSNVQAQSSSLFGSRGVTASSGTMSNGVGGQGGAQSGFGNSGSMTGFTGATAGTQSGFLSGAGVGSGLAGMSNSGNFVGNRQLSSQSGGALGQSGLGGRGGLSSGRNSISSSMRGLSQQNRTGSNRNRGAATGAQSTPIRPVQVIAFNPPARSTEAISASINADVESAVSQGRIPGVAATVDPQGTVTIEGHVATEADRRRAEALIGLEPGVRKVVNRITVSQQP